MDSLIKKYTTTKGSRCEKAQGIIFVAVDERDELTQTSPSPPRNISIYERTFPEIQAFNYLVKETGAIRYKYNIRSNPARV